MDSLKPSAQLFYEESLKLEREGQTQIKYIEHWILSGEICTTYDGYGQSLN